MPDKLSIPPEVEALRGKEYTWNVTEEVGRSSIRLFALSINHRDPIFSDQEAASQSKYGGIVAPPTFICETWQYRTGELDSKGAPIDWAQHTFEGNSRRAGNEYEFFHPLRPSDVLSVRMRVSDIYTKEGRSGPMVFVVFEYEYKNQNGQLLARHRESMVYLMGS